MMLIISINNKTLFIRHKVYKLYKFYISTAIVTAIRVFYNEYSLK
jgi:hypothetical protein